MRMLLASAALALCVGGGFMPVAAHAKGCLKGAVVGGVAGHMAGHHGALGAGAGCAVGHHEANKADHAKSTTTPDQSKHS